MLPSSWRAILMLAIRRAGGTGHCLLAWESAVGEPGRGNGGVRCSGHVELSCPPRKAPLLMGGGKGKLRSHMAGKLVGLPPPSLLWL